MDEAFEIYMCGAFKLNANEYWYQTILLELYICLTKERCLRRWTQIVEDKLKKIAALYVVKRYSSSLIMTNDWCKKLKQSFKLKIKDFSFVFRFYIM